MSRGRVLVTRPEPGATATAARLAELGYEPVVLPFSDTVPIRPVTLAEPADAVAVSSAAALRHAPPEILEQLRDLPCFCVGEVTAHAAREHGFTDIAFAKFDLLSLADLIKSRLTTKQHLVYLAGRYRIGDLQSWIRRPSARITTLECYDTVRRVPGPPELLAAPPPDAILLYSALSADVLAEIAGHAALSRWMSASRILCLSQRISSHLPDALRNRAEIASSKKEAAMLALLDSRGRKD